MKKAIQVNLNEVRECLNELRNLYSEISSLKVENQNFTGCGGTTEAINDSIAALIEYQNQLKLLIETSYRFVASSYSNAVRANKASSVIK